MPWAAAHNSSYFSWFQYVTAYKLKFNHLLRDEKEVSLHSQIFSYPCTQEKAEELKNDFIIDRHKNYVEFPNYARWLAF